MENAESFLRESFADRPELIAKVEAAAAVFQEELDCVSSVYNDNKNECA